MRACDTRCDTAARMSRNLVEFVRRMHTVDAPTAIDVLKAAIEDHGEITDEDRRAAAAASGLPEAAVYGVSSFYDDLVLPRGARHLRVCTGTACFAATSDAHVESLRESLGLEMGERREDGSLSFAETVCLGFCHSSPAFRDGDTVDAGDGALERVLAGASRDGAQPEWAQRPRRAGPDRKRRLVGARAGADGRTRPRACSRRSRPPLVRGRGGAGFPAGENGASRAHRPASRSSSSPTATRATPAPTSTSI